MLVLTRKLQESVVVGGSDRFERLLRVTVLDIKPGCVRLGFEADADVAVHRMEVWERIVAAGEPDKPARDGAAPTDTGAQETKRERVRNEARWQDDGGQG